MSDPTEPTGPEPTGPEPKGPRRRLRQWLWRRRRTGLAVSAAFGAVAAVLVIFYGYWIYAPSIGWDVTAVMFTGSAWFSIWPLSAEMTAHRATREDPSRATSDLLTLGACVASLGAVAVLLVRAHSEAGAGRGLLAALGLVSIGISWWTVHTIFTLRYAEMYYTDPVGGVDFNSDERPSYQDFMYLAMTIGMTFQVSDTDLKSTAIRATALRHALLSYLLGSLILAAAVNLVAGLG
jgi:uncharacterized membrane protein